MVTVASCALYIELYSHISPIWSKFSCYRNWKATVVAGVNNKPNLLYTLTHLSAYLTEKPDGDKVMAHHMHLLVHGTCLKNYMNLYELHAYNFPPLVKILYTSRDHIKFPFPQNYVRTSLFCWVSTCTIKPKTPKRMLVGSRYYTAQSNLISGGFWEGGFPCTTIPCDCLLNQHALIHVAARPK
jgi:hypothetical protein